MPEWMEPYRSHITNTGGNSVEDMMNSRATWRSNYIKAALAMAVESQVAMLTHLHAEGLLREPAHA